MVQASVHPVGLEMAGIVSPIMTISHSGLSLDSLEFPIIERIDLFPGQLVDGVTWEQPFDPFLESTCTHTSNKMIQGYMGSVFPVITVWVGDFRLFFSVIQLVGNTWTSTIPSNSI